MLPVKGQVRVAEDGKLHVNLFVNGRLSYVAAFDPEKRTLEEIHVPDDPHDLIGNPLEGMERK
jgi:hypothetical protein